MFPHLNQGLAIRLPEQIERGIHAQRDPRSARKQGIRVAAENRVAGGSPRRKRGYTLLKLAP
jgi:hypothetical protein